MKVAVISNLETQQGRSSFILLLASVFSRTQHRRVTIFSTGKMDSLIEQADVKNSTAAVKSVSVLRAMINAAAIKEEDFLDYASRVGEEEVYAFDIFASTIESNELENMLVSIMKKVKSDLTLVEVVGSIDSEFNKRIINECDAVLNIFNSDRQSIAAVRDYVENYDPTVVVRTGYVCQKYDANALSEKKLGTLVKMNARNVMVIPYSPVIIRESLDGTLNTLAKFIAKGHNEVITLRSRLLEVMQFLFDSPKIKYIKGVSEWHK